MGMVSHFSLLLLSLFLFISQSVLIYFLIIAYLLLRQFLFTSSLVLIYFLVTSQSLHHIYFVFLVTSLVSQRFMVDVLQSGPNIKLITNIVKILINGKWLSWNYLLAMNLWYGIHFLPQDSYAYCILLHLFIGCLCWSCYEDRRYQTFHLRCRFLG